MNRKSFLKSLLGLVIVPKVFPQISMEEQTRIEKEKIKKFYKNNNDNSIPPSGYFYCKTGLLKIN